MKITSSHFVAFLKCPTQCWLRFTSEPPSGNAYAEWEQTETESYRAAAAKRLLVSVPAVESPGSSRHLEAQLSAEALKSAKWQFAVDIPVSAEFRSSRGNEAQTSPPDTRPSHPSSATIETSLHAIERIPAAGRGKAAQFIPIRFLYRNKLTKEDKLLLAFDAFVLSEILGRAVSHGKIIHGDLRDCARSGRGNEAQTDKSEINQSLLTSAATHNGVAEPQTGNAATLGPAQPRVTKVKTAAQAGEVRKRLGKIATLLASPTPPDLVLNRHCAECEFQARCRKLAVEKDDLSLLANLSAKERQKLRSKGIFTVTQLSYTFRPRRRPKRQRDKREKYHHALKALAIREQKIHIVGSPELKLEGTPVYLDVEGLPDRDFYYLIGLRIGHGDTAVQRSLWADTVADEKEIWREFLALLETVEQPVLIHYGSYETTFLKAMKERHGKPPDESAAAKAIASAINLVSFIFARVYFPTYSNGLKEVGGWFGSKWSEANPSGATAIALRHRWEKDRDDSVKNWLIDYNCGDSAALEPISKSLALLVHKPEMFSDADLVNVPKTPATERGKELYQCLNSVRKSAQLNFAQKKFSFHPGGDENPNEYGYKLPKKAPRRQKLPSHGSHVIRVARKRKCPYHRDHPSFLKELNKEAEHTLLDIAYTKRGCKKVLVRYIGRRALCPHCHARHSPLAIQRLRGQIFGRGFHVLAVYLRVALRLSFNLVSKVIRDLLHADIPKQTILEFVEQTSKEHHQTEEALLRAILKSASIHIDETKMNILGVQQYVWVLTDGTHVVFYLTLGRETDFLHELLAQYNGTVVSDFYGGYDALPCRQQKCLVHLIRDLNDDLWKNPFDEEYEQFVEAVRDLIVPMIEDIQRYGLKCLHLKKHLRRVDRFYDRTITACGSTKELMLKYKKRFERHKNSMFTFLLHDGVSWNNNAAERAIRHLAVQRKISGAFTTKGANHYLRLLAIAQTCRFQDKSFLGFLLSGLKNVDAYKESQRGRRR